MQLAANVSRHDEKEEHQRRAELARKRRKEAIDDGRGWFRVNDLCVRWGVTRQAIYLWRRKGSLPEPVRLGPNVVAWPADVIHEFEKERTDPA